MSTRMSRSSAMGATSRALLALACLALGVGGALAAGGTIEIKEKGLKILNEEKTVSGGKELKSTVSVTGSKLSPSAYLHDANELVVELELAVVKGGPEVSTRCVASSRV